MMATFRRRAALDFGRELDGVNRERDRAAALDAGSTLAAEDGTAPARRAALALRSARTRSRARARWLGGDAANVRRHVRSST
ncbi:MAG TPA: hypothetical protein VGI29_05325 [Candidatus Binataceae bacterium]